MVAAPNGCAADCGWVLQLLLKFAEPRSWYQEPRLCPPDAANAADCEKPIVGMRVKALQLEDLKVRAVSQTHHGTPERHANMTKGGCAGETAHTAARGRPGFGGMDGGNERPVRPSNQPCPLGFLTFVCGVGVSGGVIVKLTNGKANALVKFDAAGTAATEEEAGSSGERYEVRRKVKLTERISPYSKKTVQLQRGDIIEVLEVGDYNGEERARCAQGWLSTRNHDDRRNIRRVKEEKPDL